MTGKEKIKVVIDEIAQAFDELVTGNVVKISSAELENNGLDPGEQKQVLSILANDKKLIRYKAVKNLKSEYDIDGQTWVEIYEEAAEYDVPQQLVVERLLKTLTYKIEVLDGFLAFTKGSAYIANLDQASPKSLKVTFDPHTPCLNYGDLICPIPDKSIEYFTCKLAFKNRRVPVDDTDILEAFDHTGELNFSARAVGDAKRRINTKVKRDLGLDELLLIKAQRIRINKKYQ